MSTQIQLSPALSDKTARYEALLPQLVAMLEHEVDPVANMANLCAALKHSMGFFWVGFYLVKGKELVLGPFQGPVACTRIAFGKGVCGTAWKEGKTLLVPDVEAFPGHIACSSESKSEIVVPIIKESVLMVLDVDSDQLNGLDATDAHFLEVICKATQAFIA